jgi:hypothetical protein
VKVIFLDFDGVVVTLNDQRIALPNGKRVHELNRAAVANLNKIVKETGAKVVVTSTWRLHHSLEHLQGYLDRSGFTGKVIDGTMDLWRGEGEMAKISNYRSKEIKFWLEKNSVENFVVLDDIELKGFGKRMIHVYQGWDQGGLKESHVEKAIWVLKNWKYNAG